MKYLSLLFLAISLTSNAYCSSNYYKPLVIKLDALAPGIEFEKSFYNNNTLLLNANLNGFSYGTEGLHFLKEFRSEYRYYYNIEDRIANKKIISKYSGNFFSITFMYIYGHPLDYGDDYIIGPTWGMQRCFLDYFRWNFNLGLGHTPHPWPIHNSFLSPIIRGNLGFIFQLK